MRSATRGQHARWAPPVRTTPSRSSSHAIVCSPLAVESVAISADRLASDSSSNSKEAGMSPDGSNTVVELPDGSVPPSGNQYLIHHGDQVATIVEVGGGIRTYSHGGRDVLDPYPIGEMCDGAHGTPLIPWPNRLEDGWYEFNGAAHQVALTEPDKRNAIHGFLRWRSWSLREHEEDMVTMGIRLGPMMGYPFRLDVSVTYRLAEDGLTVSTTATNTGTAPCPYGAGQHPYLSGGGAPIDHCTLGISARTRVLTDPDRQLPTGLEDVSGTKFDFRSPTRLGALRIDHAFTDLDRDSGGRSWVRLRGPDGSTARTWVDEHHELVQIYTGDSLAPHRRRRGLGTEPMTCPPNAFRTGESVIVLAPSESVTSCWGADLIAV